MVLFHNLIAQLVFECSWMDVHGPGVVAWVDLRKGGAQELSVFLSHAGHGSSLEHLESCHYNNIHVDGLRPSTRSFVRLPVERPIDEETLPHYEPEQFYPVHIGDVFNDRYRVTGKLGFGVYSKIGRAHV